MRPVSVREAHPIVLCEFEAAGCVRISHDLGSRHSVGIELVVPGRVERIGPVNSLAVTADLDHLRTAYIRLAARVGGTANDAADVDRTRKPWLPRIGDVVLTQL